MFVPNDIVLGGNKPTSALVTGPNMGGKSTLLRQAAVLVVLAQVWATAPRAGGAFVASCGSAVTCHAHTDGCVGASIVLRVEPRNQNLHAGGSQRSAPGRPGMQPTRDGCGCEPWCTCVLMGMSLRWVLQSTFFVEAEETAAILRDSTRNSLVIVDELGRGTSTFDGAALASSVLAHLTETIGCRCLFATHYHALTTEFRGHPNIALFHMACMVDGQLCSDSGDHSAALSSVRSCPWRRA